ncbi:MAG: EAL domain-containing protein [Steroidobacteraceae bacterium]
MGLAAPRVAVNVSAVQLRRRDFVESVHQALKESGKAAGIGIALEHSLKLTVVAEGVENEEQAKILGLLRCDEIQGYLIRKPLPCDEMTEFLKQSPN